VDDMQNMVEKAYHQLSFVLSVIAKRQPSKQKWKQKKI